MKFCVYHVSCKLVCKKFSCGYYHCYWQPSVTITCLLTNLPLITSLYLSLKELESRYALVKRCCVRKNKHAPLWSRWMLYEEGYVRMSSERICAPARCFARMRRAELIPLLRNTQFRKHNTTAQPGWPIQPTFSPSGYRDALAGGPADSVPSESPLPRGLMASFPPGQTVGRTQISLEMLIGVLIPFLKVYPHSLPHQQLQHE